MPASTRRLPELRIKLAPSLLVSLIEMFRARGTDTANIENFARELLEQPIIEYRSKKFTRPELAPPRDRGAIDVIRLPHRQRLSPAEVQRVLFLRGQGLTVEEIGTRVSRCPGTIHKILNESKRCQTHTHVGMPRTVQADRQAQERGGWLAVKSRRKADG
jgi:hypothetical protein